MGTFDIDHRHGKQLAGWWKIPYAKGSIKAIAYDEAGNVLATEERWSFGEPAEIRLQADKNTLAADGQDLVFVEIAMADAQGNPVENAVNRVQVLVSGAGRLVGLDNGDSTDYDSYKGTSRRLFSGKLMAVVGATLEAGPVLLEVSSEGLKTRSIELHARLSLSGAVTGISGQTANTERPCLLGRASEKPVRKIELVSDTGLEFNENCTTRKIRALLHPQDTSYREVEWSVVNETGIPSNLATVEAFGLEAVVTASGDGEFQIGRASWRETV